MRERFPVGRLFSEPGPRLVYTHHNCMVVGRRCPAQASFMLSHRDNMAETEELVPGADGSCHAVLADLAGPEELDALVEEALYGHRREPS